MTVPSLRVHVPRTRVMARLPHAGQGRTPDELISRRLPLVCRPFGGDEDIKNLLLLTVEITDRFHECSPSQPDAPVGEKQPVAHSLDY